MTQVFKVTGLTAEQQTLAAAVAHSILESNQEWAAHEREKFRTADVHPGVLLQDAPPPGTQVLTGVEIAGDEIRMNTQPFAAEHQVKDKDIMPAVVTRIIKASRGGLDILAIVALPDGMRGLIEARSFRNHRAFPLSKRLREGQEILVSVDLSKGTKNGMFTVNATPQKKAVFNRLRPLAGTDTVLTGVVSGRHGPDGPYYVALEGVLDAALYPDCLKKEVCGCRHCNKHHPDGHPEELEVGQEVQVHILAMTEVQERVSGETGLPKSAGYRIMLTRNFG
jgi:hypothetical protein